MLSGIGMQLVNPKGILFCVTVAANYFAPYYRTLPPIAGLILMLSALIFVSTSSWSLFGSDVPEFHIGATGQALQPSFVLALAAGLLRRVAFPVE